MVMAASSYNQYESFQTPRRTCRKSGLRRRCLMMVKQQKTRFYILGRCVSMLLCWHVHGSSD
ncbi:DVL protein [Dioscorea alata]|uniref:DVL protein n=1 Tax=Dioscorea alata TaxID=55571 RepID=A0ACB7TTT9_DIOAL|nr:DVL protein [Dioscorea alata]